jgi:hypothetical protein
MPMAWMLLFETNITSAQVLRKEYLRAIKEVKSLPNRGGVVYPGSTEYELHKLAGIWKSSLLLLGYAVETALKAILVGQTHLKNYDGPTVEELLKKYSHNLITIAEKVGIDLSESDKILLDHLTSTITWRGKYLLPFKKDDYLQNHIKILKKNPIEYMDNSNEDDFAPEVANFLMKCVPLYQEAEELYKINQKSRL